MLKIIFVIDIRELAPAKKADGLRSFLVKRSEKQGRYGSDEFQSGNRNFRSGTVGNSMKVPQATRLDKQIRK